MHNVAQSISPIWLKFLQQAGLIKLGNNKKFQLKRIRRSEDLNLPSMRESVIFGIFSGSTLFSKYSFYKQRRELEKGFFYQRSYR